MIQSASLNDASALNALYCMLRPKTGDMSLQYSLVYFIQVKVQSAI